MGHLLDNLGMVAIWSVPFYFALTGQLKGRAKGISLWAYFWLLAAFSGLNLWHFAVVNQELSAHAPPGYSPLPRQEFDERMLLWIGSLMTVVLLVLPVIWYRQDARKLQETQSAADQPERRETP